MVKKTISLILALTMILALSVQSFAVEETASIEEMNTFLIDRGYPEHYLKSLIDIQVERLYDMVVKEDAYFYGIEKGNQIFQEPAESRISAIPESELDFDILLSCTTESINNVQYVSQLIVNVDYEWTKLPSIRQDDGITVNWDSSYFNFDSRTAEFKAYDYAKDADGNWLTYKSYSTPVEAELGGLGYITDISYKDIYTGITRPAIGLRGSASFKLEPAVTMKYIPEFPNVISSQISANYVHNARVPNFGINFSTTNMGVTITNSTLAYGMAKTATFKFSV